MSQSTDNAKVISTFHIELSDAFKAVLDAHSIEMTKTQEAIASYKAMQPSGQLLTAMQAANDVPEPELKQMGQWVFEGQDERYISAAVDGNGKANLYPVVKEKLWFSSHSSVFSVGRPDYLELEGEFNTEHWEQSAINRLPVNDVDYLSDTPTDHDTTPIEPIFSDGELAAVYPKITSADMQLIFIKNLSSVLIQRMHSMDRFSTPDNLILGSDIEKWDAVVTISSDAAGNKVFSIAGYSTNESLSMFFKAQRRTITEAELPAFRAAMEACYA